MMTVLELIEALREDRESLVQRKKDVEQLTKRIEWLNKELLSRPTMDPTVEMLATHVIYIEGDWKKAIRGDGGSQIDSAIDDITTGCRTLRSNYIGVKSYDRWSAQGANHGYNMGPRHGYVYAEIGLTKEARERDLTEEEKSAAVQYLLAYKAKLQEK